MSTIDFVVDQVSGRTEGDPKTVRELLGRGVRHIPEGTPVNRASMAAALEATRLELTDPEEIRIIERIEGEFQAMGMLKQILVFSTISGGIDELRRELKG